MYNIIYTIYIQRKIFFRQSIFLYSLCPNLEGIKDALLLLYIIIMLNLYAWIGLVLLWLLVMWKPVYYAFTLFYFSLQPSLAACHFPSVQISYQMPQIISVSVLWCILTVELTLLWSVTRLHSVRLMEHGTLPYLPAQHLSKPQVGCSPSLKFLPSPFWAFR